MWGAVCSLDLLKLKCSERVPQLPIRRQWTQGQKTRRAGKKMPTIINLIEKEMLDRKGKINYTHCMVQMGRRVTYSKPFEC